MKHIWKLIENAIEMISAFLILIMIVLLFFNSMMRYFAGQSLAWCEELCRFMLIGIVFLGICVAIRKGILLRIDILDTALQGKPVLNVIKVVIGIIAIVTQIAFAYSGILLVEVGRLSYSSALAIPMWIVYLIVPIGYILGAIQSSIDLVKLFKGFKEEVNQGV